MYSKEEALLVLNTLNENPDVPFDEHYESLKETLKTHGVIAVERELRDMGVVLTRQFSKTKVNIDINVSEYLYGNTVCKSIW